MRQVKTSITIVYSACCIFTSAVPSKMMADSTGQIAGSDSHSLRLFMSAEEQQLIEKIPLLSDEHFGPTEDDSADDGIGNEIPDSDYVSNGQLKQGNNDFSQYRGVVMRGTHVLDVWIDGRRYSNGKPGHGLLWPVQGYLPEEAQLHDFHSGETISSDALSSLSRGDGFSINVLSQ